MSRLVSPHSDRSRPVEPFVLPPCIRCKSRPGAGTIGRRGRSKEKSCFARGASSSSVSSWRAWACRVSNQNQGLKTASSQPRRARLGRCGEVRVIYELCYSRWWTNVKQG